MNDNQRTILAQEISIQIEACKADIVALEKVTQPVAPDASLGRLTRMDNIVNNSVNKARLNASQNRLNKLEQAQANLDDPDFGHCHECGEPIPVPRLMAMPETTFCIECAE